MMPPAPVEVVEYKADESGTKDHMDVHLGGIVLFRLLLKTFDICSLYKSAVTLRSPASVLYNYLFVG